MGLQGSGLSDTNTRLRFFLIVFMGLIAMGSVLYWRSQLISTTEYVDLGPTHKIKKSDDSKLKSKNFEIETIETSPSVN